MPNFWLGKKVFITGHTGFKGSWLCRVLMKLGADITGYSLTPPTFPNMFELSDIEKNIRSVTSDIRDFDRLKSVFDEANPEIVFHLAAQPIVRDGYELPRYTYETNVMGTVNVLECMRTSDTVKSFLNVTTDKVYKNNEWHWGYREDDVLCGLDPYSNSKSCSEMVTHSYKKSFFKRGQTAISTARAGNVIGGGDFANDRIIPDCIRAAVRKEPIIVRNPNSVRPYQHVLEPVFAYLMIAQKQYEEEKYAGYYNIGPDDADCVTTGTLVNIFCDEWKDGLKWEYDGKEGPHEANFLKLDCSKLKSVFGWSPKWHIKEAVQKTCEWTKAWLNKEDTVQIMDRQIEEYMKVNLR